MRKFTSNGIIRQQKAGKSLNNLQNEKHILKHNEDTAQNNGRLKIETLTLCSKMNRAFSKTVPSMTFNLSFRVPLLHRLKTFRIHDKVLMDYYIANSFTNKIQCKYIGRKKYR